MHRICSIALRMNIFRCYSWTCSPSERCNDFGYTGCQRQWLPQEGEGDSEAAARRRGDHSGEAGEAADGKPDQEARPLAREGGVPDREDR